MSLFYRLCLSQAPASVLFIRIMVGCIFLSEGVQKFLFPEALGVGRFSQIGLPLPELLAPMVGSLEMLCGLFLLLGFFTRLAALPLIVIMLGALISTKIPILEAEGFWKMAHESRTDFSMLLGSLFLLMVGGGPVSLDAWLTGKQTRPAGQPAPKSSRAVPVKPPKKNNKKNKPSLRKR